MEFLFNCVFLSSWFADPNDEILSLSLGSCFISSPLTLADSDYVGKLGVVSGWGRVTEKGDPTDTLKEALLPIFSNPVCRALRYHPHEITDNMICAGYVHGGTDSCHSKKSRPLRKREHAAPQSDNTDRFIISPCCKMQVQDPWWQDAIKEPEGSPCTYKSPVSTKPGVKPELKRRDK
ncbi:anionic trypsin-like [Procambarus clarkii]|uniref:anionic trypsin-like n=1 Tax=Procambarus clarkii TaxID=6728 RepID=UPI0037437FAF